MYAIATLILYVALIHLQMNKSLNQDLEKNSNILVILGAKVPNGEISPVLKSRLDKGFELWQQSPHLKVIVSGGGSEAPIFEAQLMHDYLLQKGMNPQNIFIESKSTNTYENLQNCRGMCSNSCTVVSSEFHAVRTIFLAKRLGMEATFIGAKTPKGRRLKNEAREHIAIIKSWFLDR